MLIIWGSKRKELELGWVADLCLACGRPTAHRLREVRSVSHLYYISLGNGSLAGYEIVCRECGRVGAAETDDYADFGDEPDEDLGALVERTNPELPRRIVAREDLARRIADGSASPEDRLHALTETLFAFAAELEERGKETHFDLRAGLWLLGVFVAPFAVGVAAQALFAGGSPVPSYLALGSIGVCVVMLVVALATEGSRYARKKLIPQMLPRLRELKPTLEELEEVLGRFKKGGLALGKKLKPLDVFEALAGSSCQNAP
ncbi:MAG: hypothetical protein M5U26_05835 [Planctomycetota bacterium]|nr:hypothetical protein [Planctomycetota bacterium]